MNSATDRIVDAIQYEIYGIFANGRNISERIMINAVGSESNADEMTE